MNSEESKNPEKNPEKSRTRLTQVYKLVSIQNKTKYGAPTDFWRAQESLRRGIKAIATKHQTKEEFSN